MCIFLSPKTKTLFLKDWDKETLFGWRKEKNNVFEMYLNDSERILVYLANFSDPTVQQKQVRPDTSRYVPNWCTNRPNAFAYTTYLLWFGQWFLRLTIIFCFAWVLQVDDLISAKKTRVAAHRCERKGCWQKQNVPKTAVFFSTGLRSGIFFQVGIRHTSQTKIANIKTVEKNNGPLQIAFTPTVCLPIPKRSIYPSTDVSAVEKW